MEALQTWPSEDLKKLRLEGADSPEERIAVHQKCATALFNWQLRYVVSGADSL